MYNGRLLGLFSAFFIKGERRNYLAFWCRYGVRTAIHIHKDLFTVLEEDTSSSKER